MHTKESEGNWTGQVTGPGRSAVKRQDPCTRYSSWKLLAPHEFNSDSQFSNLYNICMIFQRDYFQRTRIL